eukprot:3094434-Rhodomonas_salina.1
MNAIFNESGTAFSSLVARGQRVAASQAGGMSEKGVSSTWSSNFWHPDVASSYQLSNLYYTLLTSVVKTEFC